MVHAATVDKYDWSQDAKEFAEFLAECCAPPSNEPTEVWAERNVVIQEGPFAGSNWRLMFTPFAKWMFAAFRDPKKKRHTVMMSAQYVKTMALLIDLLRNAKEDPANAMWVMAEADHMDEFIEKRLLPYIEACPAVAPLLVGCRKSMITLDSMKLMLRGSGSRAKLQSDPVRRVYCDERREWKKGAIDLLRKRMRTFPNAVEISAGTPGVENDELHRDYLEGTQTRAHIRCLQCGHSQPIRFGRDVTTLWKTKRECGGFIWDVNETTKPNGKWDYPAVKATVRFECENPQCRARYTNAEKYELLRTMHPHDYNPKPQNPEYTSFGGSAFEAIWESCDWDKLVEEFLKAVEEARAGNVEPLKAFITETLGEPWADRIGVIEDYGFLEARKGAYSYGDVWAEKIRRFMAADKQERGGEHYWYVIRDFGMNGASRLVTHGRVNTKLELETIRRNYKVGDKSAMIDSGYLAQDVYRFAGANKWMCMKGDRGEFFLVAVPHPTIKGVTVPTRQLWLKTTVVVYNERTKRKMGNLPLFIFKNDPTNELLTEYMLGLTGEWLIPKDTEAGYFAQIAGDVRKEKTDSRGVPYFEWHTVGDNHYRDCERMILTAAIVTKTIAAPTPKHTNLKAPKG